MSHENINFILKFTTRFQTNKKDEAALKFKLILGMLRWWKN